MTRGSPLGIRAAGRGLRVYGRLLVPMALAVATVAVGSGGAAVRSAGATTGGVAADLVKNASFETDTSGWNTSVSGPGVTLTRVAGGHSGEWAAELANGGTAATTCQLNDPPNWVATTAAGGRYTAPLWVRSATPGATLKLRLQEWRNDNSGLAGSASSAATLTTSWQQVSARYKPNAPGVST